jgi:hypothetical protein
MSDDFELRAIRTRAQALVVQRRAAETKWAAAKLDDDEALAGQAAQTIADIDAQGENLNRLYEQEMRRRNPPAQVPETEGEFQSRAPERMTYVDTIRIMGKSKYRLSPEQEAENLRQGVAELQRRKASGDLQS